MFASATQKFKHILSIEKNTTERMANCDTKENPDKEHLYQKTDFNGSKSMNNENNENEFHNSKPTWTKQDVLLLIQCAFIEFGDGVEAFLPGTMTQLVSCDLDVSKVQEGFLGVIFEAALAFAVIVISPVTAR